MSFIKYVNITLINLIIDLKCLNLCAIYLL